MLRVVLSIEFDSEKLASYCSSPVMVSSIVATSAISGVSVSG